MNSILGLENIAAHVEVRPSLESTQPPRLLLELEPWGRTFRRNLTDVLLQRRPPTLAISSEPAPFWPDVFVTRRLPWVAFAESLLYHGIVLALAWGFSAFLARRPLIVQVRPFDPAEVIYYSPSEYLPPLDTGRSHVTKTRKGDPESAKQPILSVPPESDNRQQTIVTPPDIKLTQDVETPNIIAWGDHTVPVPGAAIDRKPSQLPALPNQIVAPVPDVNQASNTKLQPLSQPIVAPPHEVKDGVHVMASLSIDVVAPAPDANGATSRRALRGPESAVVEPPPAINAASIRKMGDINMGHSDVIAPAPQLAVEAQRTPSTLGIDGQAVVPPPPSVDGAGTGPARGSARHARAQMALGASSGQVVPPPPSIPSAHTADAGGRIIALGIHPSAAPLAEPPQGNRRGTFAATPEGKVGAAGTPDIRADSATGTDGRGMSKDGAGAGSGSTNGSPAGAPPGLHVGAAAKPATSAQAGGDPSTGAIGRASGTAGKGEIASLSEPRTRPASGSPPQPKAELVDNPSPLERQIFRDRRLYSMTLNMPNLNSAGGSWVIRFAELDSSHEKGELIAPVAEHKVDPAYPMQLMRENVSGTVTLRAIIRADGSVSDIQVVSGADARLDRYASQALARWHFRPAIKNDTTVDVEAIVMIPFKPILRTSPF
jgi:TonB family protein